MGGWVVSPATAFVDPSALPSDGALADVHEQLDDACDRTWFRSVPIEARAEYARLFTVQALAMVEAVP